MFKNKNHSIICGGLLLVPHKKSNVSVYSFLSKLGYISSCSTLLRCFSSGPSYSCSKFKFKCLPPRCEHFYISGNDAVKFVTLKDKVEKTLGRFVDDKENIRLAFAFVDLIPNDTLDARRNQSKPLSFSELLHQIKKAIYQLFSGLSYHEEGLEFVFSSKAIDLLLNMINDVIKCQGLSPEMIHI